MRTRQVGVLGSMSILTKIVLLLFAIAVLDRGLMLARGIRNLTAARISRLVGPLLINVLHYGLHGLCESVINTGKL